MEIFVGRADGKGTPRKLTSNTVFDDNPAWSPDGTQIVYESGPQLMVTNSFAFLEMQVNWSETTLQTTFSIQRPTFFLKPSNTATAPL